MAEEQRTSKNRLSALEAVARAASELLELVQHKDEPPSSEHNQRLYNRGDVILVNEGPLWHLLGKLQALGAADETSAECNHDGYRKCWKCGKSLVIDCHECGAAQNRDGAL